MSSPTTTSSRQQQSSEELQQWLADIRLSIIGDEDEKLALLESPDLDDIFVFLQRLSSGEMKDAVILEHLLVIVYSLSFLSEGLPKLITKYNVLPTMLSLACRFKDDDGVLTFVFKVLFSILSSKKDTNLDLTTAQGMLFKNLLYHKIDMASSHDDDQISKHNQVLLNIFSLIPHLNPSELKNLVNPCLRVLELIMNKPGNALHRRYGRSSIYANCYNSMFVPNPPSMVMFSNITAPLLFSVSSLLYHDDDLLTDDSIASQNVKIDDIMSKSLYFTISSALKSNDFEMKLASISILVHYSLNSNLTDSEKNNNIKKLLPYLIQLIDLNDPKVNLSVYKSELNLSRDFNPFHILSKLCLKFEFVSDFLLNCNIIKKFSEIITKFSSFDLSDLPLMKLDNLSDLFFILSSLTSNSESNRDSIIDDYLSTMVEKILKLHYQNLKNFLDLNQSYPIFDQMGTHQSLEKSHGLMLVSNHLAVSTCNLLRSLSRSVSILRTYLNETNIVDCLLAILKIPEGSLIESFASRNSYLLNSEISLRSVILAVISNLVLDFSPLRHKLLDGGLIDIISDLILTSQYNSIKTNCLWVLRHVIYNENTYSCNRALGKIGMDNIIEFCNNDDLMIQEQAFNVLRNLTCSSKPHVEKLLHFHFQEDENDDSTEPNLFQFIDHKLSQLSVFDNKNDGLMESIIFIIVHIAAIDESKRDLILENESLLMKLLNIMNYSENHNVKLACIWVVINLTWIEDPTSSSHRPMTFEEDREEEGDDDDDEDDDFVIEEEDEIMHDQDLVDETGDDIEDNEGDVIPEQRGGVSRRYQSFPQTAPIPVGSSAASSANVSPRRPISYLQGGSGSNVTTSGSTYGITFGSFQPRQSPRREMGGSSSRRMMSSSGGRRRSVNTNTRIEKLKALGFPKVLSELEKNSDNIDLKEKLRIALNNFDAN